MNVSFRPAGVSDPRKNRRGYNGDRIPGVHTSVNAARRECVRHGRPVVGFAPIRSPQDLEIRPLRRHPILGRPILDDDAQIIIARRHLIA